MAAIMNFFSPSGPGFKSSTADGSKLQIHVCMLHLPFYSFFSCYEVSQVPASHHFWQYYYLSEIQTVRISGQFEHAKQYNCSFPICIIFNSDYLF